MAKASTERSAQADAHIVAWAKHRNPWMANSDARRYVRIVRSSLPF